MKVNTEPALPHQRQVQHFILAVKHRFTPKYKVGMFRVIVEKYLY